MRRSALLLVCAVLVAPARADDRIIFEAKLNDRPLRLGFDTGAGAIIIWQSVAEKLGLKVTPPSADAKAAPGQVAIGWTEAVQLELFGPARSESVGVIKTPPMLSMEIDGVVGWPTFRKKRWVTRGGSTLEIEPLSDFSLETKGWIELTEFTEGQSLTLEHPSRGAAPLERFGIDTGNEYGVRLFPKQWAAWRAAHSQQPVTMMAYFMPADGTVVKGEVWADEIEIAGIKFTDVPVTEATNSEVLIKPTGTVAIIGIAALKRLDFVFDGKNHVAYAKPLGTPSVGYAHNRLGAVFVETNESSSDLMAHVAAGSPAAIAGVQAGDILLKIDALDVTPWRTQPGILPLRRFFEQASGTKLHLTLRRDGRTIAVDVTLRDIIGPKSN